MKKIYIPDERDLIIIQRLSNNKGLYKYILSKVLESLLSEKKQIQDFDELYDVGDLAFAWCYLHPEQIKDFPSLRNNQELALRLIGKKPKYPFSELDCLRQFNSSVFEDHVIVNRVIELLSKHIDTNPMFRFEYKECDLLDAIFGVEYERFNECAEATKYELMDIDPIYYIRFKPNYFTPLKPDDIFTTKVINYSSRYGISQTAGIEYTSDITRNPKVKKLIKFMNEPR